MTAQPALTVTACMAVPALQLGDAQIIQATDLAAECYGFAQAADLVGRYISDLQTLEARQRGKLSWGLRQLGHTVDEAYTTLVRRPDGEVVGHRGRLLTTFADMHHQQSYLTELTVAQQLDDMTIPDVASYGVSMDEIHRITGRFTVAQWRDMVRKDSIPLHHGETFTTILQECEWNATHIFGWHAGTGLDLMLRRDLCTWTLEHTPDEKAPRALVYFHAACPHCGRQWWRRSSRRLEWRCPTRACSAYLP